MTRIKLFIPNNFTLGLRDPFQMNNIMEFFLLKGYVYTYSQCKAATWGPQKATINNERRINILLIMISDHSILRGT